MAFFFDEGGKGKRRRGRGTEKDVEGKITLRSYPEDGKREIKKRKKRKEKKISIEMSGVITHTRD